MLNAVFADDFKEISDEYDEDSFQNKELYIISLLGKIRGDNYCPKCGHKKD